MSNPEVYLAIVNAVCNTISVVALAWIGATVGRVERNQHDIR